MHIITWADSTYPEPLRTIPDPPRTLYVQGELRPSDHLAVAIVGARRATPYGIQCAERLSARLARLGLTIVSGLAYGIDAAAHRGALDAGGRTIAVLGSGLDRLYPPEHKALASRIAAQGAVISEYPMLMEPFAGNFPKRNRIISGLALGTVVVEATARSGSLITANCALEQGRDVFAVPGPMASATSEGAHSLLKDGARLVTGIEDILEELGLMICPEPAPPPGGGGTGTGIEGTGNRLSTRIFEAIPETEASHIDAIAASAGAGIAEVAATLLQLELRGLVRQLPGKYFARR